MLNPSRRSPRYCRLALANVPPLSAGGRNACEALRDPVDHRVLAPAPKSICWAWARLANTASTHTQKTFLTRNEVIRSRFSVLGLRRQVPSLRLSCLESPRIRFLLGTGN